MNKLLPNTLKYSFCNPFIKSSPLKAVFILTGILLLAACNETRSIQEARLAAESGTALNSQPETAVKTVSPGEIEFDQFEDLYLSSETSHSIWTRIHAGFQLPSDIQHEALETEINWFAKHPEYIHRVIARADPFLYYIMEEIEKRNMPAELVLLPIVESAYQPFAYSHGRAAGIWQFIPSTGRMYGLKQNWWYDGRRDIYASTQAALNYLDNMHKQFDGDWLLALAAYNSGSGTVQRAIKRNKRLERPTDFWHLKLPKETSAYVPKLLALKEIIANPEKYEISLDRKSVV